MQKELEQRRPSNGSRRCIHQAARDCALHRGVRLGRAHTERGGETRERALGLGRDREPQEHEDILWLEHHLPYSRIAQGAGRCRDGSRLDQFDVNGRRVQRSRSRHSVSHDSSARQSRPEEA